MRTVILTEGGASKGLGHMARAMALFEGFRERGVKCEVVVDGDVDLTGLFQGAVYHRQPWPSSVEMTEHFTRGTDITILDSYNASAEVCAAASRHARLIVFFDDFIRLNYSKGHIFNGGVSAPQMPYPAVLGVTYHLGSLFAPLRREFWDIEPQVIRQEIKKIFVVFGGVDGRKLTSRVIDCLLEKFNDFEYSVVVGLAFRDDSFFERIGRFAGVKVYRSLSAMQILVLMRQADVAVSAAGQTICELARLGLPTVGVLAAENQRTQWRGMIDSGFAVDGGCADDPDVVAQIVRGLHQLSSVDERRRRSNTGRILIDGQGVRRCVDVILKEMERI